MTDVIDMLACACSCGKQITNWDLGICNDCQHAPQQLEQHEAQQHAAQRGDELVASERPHDPEEQSQGGAWFGDEILQEQSQGGAWFGGEIREPLQVWSQPVVPQLEQHEAQQLPAEQEEQEVNPCQHRVGKRSYCFVVATGESDPTTEYDVVGDTPAFFGETEKKRSRKGNLNASYISGETEKKRRGSRKGIANRPKIPKYVPNLKQTLPPKDEKQLPQPTHVAVETTAEDFLAGIGDEDLASFLSSDNEYVPTLARAVSDDRSTKSKGVDYFDCERINVPRCPPGMSKLGFLVKMVRHFADQGLDDLSRKATDEFVNCYSQQKKSTSPERLRQLLEEATCA